MEKGKTKNRDKDIFMWEELIQFLGQMDRNKTLPPNAQKGICTSLLLPLSSCRKKKKQEMRCHNILFSHSAGPQRRLTSTTATSFTKICMLLLKMKTLQMSQLKVIVCHIFFFCCSFVFVCFSSGKLHKTEIERLQSILTVAKSST